MHHDHGPTTADAGLRNRRARHSLRKVRPSDLYDAWLFAEAEGSLALAAWKSAGSNEKADAYAVYLAAFEREAQAARTLEFRLAAA